MDAIKIKKMSDEDLSIASKVIEEEIKSRWRARRKKIMSETRDMSAEEFCRKYPEYCGPQVLD